MKKEKETKTITILQHNISYWYDNGQDMPEHEEEHVADMIGQGFCAGELNDSNDTEENRGWWKIDNS